MMFCNNPHYRTRNYHDEDHTKNHRLFVVFDVMLSRLDLKTFINSGLLKSKLKIIQNIMSIKSIPSKIASVIDNLEA